MTAEQNEQSETPVWEATIAEAEPVNLLETGVGKQIHEMMIVLPRGVAGPPSIVRISGKSVFLLSHSRRGSRRSGWVCFIDNGLAVSGGCSGCRNQADQIQTLTNSLNEAVSQRDALQGRLEAATTEGCRFSLELYRMTGVRDNLQAQLAAITAERNEQSELLETVNAACRSLVDELTAWKTHAKDLGDSLVSKRQEIQTLRKTLHEVTGQRDTLLEALAAMAATMAERNKQSELLI